ncbi:hypothetical protein GCM10007160_32950 [Litchfieldella qijiaojingensis]|uniref:Uncharacterized protein n=1 Tax=Litchfieldella qijiaojingensis TaxID=980347 RepID=A0ABQ2Z4W3_9GAMM|nr:hypothetical protein [Halomonas qijiaojingensis]GGY02551.1 hypothetical protein GCM10007160_32950 [Halomonas qijiaojingensis]
MAQIGPHAAIVGGLDIRDGGQVASTAIAKDPLPGSDTLLHSGKYASTATYGGASMMSKEFLKKLSIFGVSFGLITSPLAFGDFHEEEEEDKNPAQEQVTDDGGNGAGFSTEYENEEQETEGTDEWEEEESEEEEWEEEEEEGNGGF